MKTILRLAFLSLISVIPFLQAYAQDQRVSVNVPFAFHVGSATLPAGIYVIDSSPMRPLIGITGANPKIHTSAFVLTDPHGVTGRDVVVFHRYANQYFLSRIVRSGGANELSLLPDKAEKQARRETRIAGLALLDPVILATNDEPLALPSPRTPR